MKHWGTQRMETERLILRPFRQSDAADMLDLWIADPAVQSEYGEPVYETPEQVGALLERWIAGYGQPSFYRWAIEEKQSGRNIGQIAFCRVYEDCCAAEIEYCISARFWGRGYAGEALQAVIQTVFANTDFAWLETFHRQENTRSGRVLEKSPMHITGTVERFRRKGLMPEGEVCYRIGRPLYHASQTPGLTVLEPRVSNHGKPLVYASAKRENVLVYLSNAVEKHCREAGFAHGGPWQKWGSYGFANGLLQLDEYWPGATLWTYSGVSGYIDTVEGDFAPMEGIPYAYISEKPARVTDCAFLPDAYQALLQAEREGKLLLRSYDALGENMRRWVRQTVREEYADASAAPDYRLFLQAKFPYILEK